MPGNPQQIVQYIKFCKKNWLRDDVQGQNFRPTFSIASAIDLSDTVQAMIQNLVHLRVQTDTVNWVSLDTFYL